MPDQKPLSLTARLNATFRRVDQSAPDFVREISARTDADRVDFRRWFAEIGQPCIEKTA